MRSSAGGTSWSFQRLFVFWWILLLLLQQAERLFLLPKVWSHERPTAAMLVQVLTAGLRGDLITATGGVVLAAVLAGVYGLLLAAIGAWRGTARQASGYRRGFTGSCLLLACLLAALLAVDTGYYLYSQQHLDFVFFEYLRNLLGWGSGQAEAIQASQQTTAELREGRKWLLSLSGLIILEAVLIAAWWLWFRRTVGAALARWESMRPRTTAAVLALALLGGATGMHPRGLAAIRAVEIDSAAYYMLAQNPVLYGGEALRAAFDPRWIGPTRTLRAMPLEEAVRVTQEVLGHGATFPDRRYPLVREAVADSGVHFTRPANVLLLFIEGLDRRFLGRTLVVGGDPTVALPSTAAAPRESASNGRPPLAQQRIRLTPFLDQLKVESLFFENFFTNAAQTSRGLLASFCSYYPRHGTIDMNTRYTRDYVCLPSLLRRDGYRTELVIGQHRDINNVHTFMMRNGLHQLFDEADFPDSARRLGLGITDGALFDFLRARLEVLQASGQSFLLAALTLSTHHPFAIPLEHPEVLALQAVPDGYVAALRYTDLELQRFFTGLQRDGLLKNTVVFILGDHGRHEPIGRTDLERQIGHFMAPLFIWMDESLRRSTTFHPRVVSTVASQVDLAPTILALNGLVPRRAPFLGNDLSCLLVADCLHDNVAYMNSVDDDLIAMADRDGLSLYLLRAEAFYQADLKLAGPAVRRRVTDPDVAARYHRMLALYISSNRLLERNRIWSWTALGGML
jgi:hypothetical protein